MKIWGLLVFVKQELGDGLRLLRPKTLYWCGKLMYKSHLNNDSKETKMTSIATGPGCERFICLGEHDFPYQATQATQRPSHMLLSSLTAFVLVAEMDRRVTTRQFAPESPRLNPTLPCGMTGNEADRKSKSQRGVLTLQTRPSTTHLIE